MVSYLKILTLFFATLLLTVNQSIAEINPDIRFKNYTTEDGLSQNTIMDIIQDKDGFVWISCENGLNKFDGFNFTAYSPVITNTGFVLNTRLRYLKLMNDGMLWIEYQDRNPYVCYHKKFGFETWGTHFLGVEIPDRLYLNNLLLCSDGKYWASIDNQILKQTQVGYFENKMFLDVASFPIGQTNPTLFWEDNNQGLWLVPKADSILAKIDLKDHSYADFSLEHKPKIVPVEKGYFFYNDSLIYFYNYQEGNASVVVTETSAKIRSIFYEGETLFYNTDQSRIHCISKQQKSAYFVNRSEYVYGNLIHSTDVDENGQIWMAVPGLGALVYSEKSNQFVSLQPDSLNPSSIAKYSTNNVLCNSDGSVFLGSMYDGLSVYVPSKNDFNQPPHLNNSLQKYPVNSLTIDPSGMLWLSAGNGEIFSIDIMNDQITSTLISHSDLHIGPMLWDNDSVLWFGAWERGLYQYNLKSHKLHNISELVTFKYLSSNQKFVRKITKDRLNNLWVNTHDGLLKIPSTRKSIQEIHPDFPPNDHRNAFNYNFTTCALSDGNLMIGAENGVTEIDQDGNWIRNFYPDRKNPQSISHKTIFSLMEDSGGRIWAGTYNGGLNCIDRKTEKCEVFTILEGLPDNSVSGIQEDSLGNIWLVTETGLSCFNPAQKTFVNFTKDDGLPSNSIGGRSFQKITNRCFVAPTDKGLFTFDPIKISQRKSKNRLVVITNFEVIDSPKDFQYFVKNNEAIVLSPKEKVFKIDFVAPTFDIPEKINYEYKIDDLHTSWMDNGKNNEIIFTNLPPGKHQLQIRVKAINNCTFQPTTIPLTIIPPFYQTLLFRVLIVVVLMGLIALYFLTRIRRLKQLEKIRMQIANDLHDEIGSSLGTISYIGYQLKTEELTKTSLADLGLELNAISKKTADSMRDIIWFINPQNDSFDKLVERMNEFATRMLFQSDLSFDIKFSETIHDIHLSVKRNLYLIFKETINNIAKHADASEVTVVLNGNNREINLTITDNGVGFDTSKGYTGMGINSISKRVAQINGQLQIDSTPGEGTKTNLSILLWKKLPKSF